MKKSTFKRMISVSLLIMLFVCSGITLFGQAQPGNRGFNYAEALQKSILFYENQRSGSLSTASINTRIPWRGDSQLTDGSAQGVDLTGGWVDAGDNMKYGFPMSSAVSVLAWGAYEYAAGLKSSGQWTWLLNQLKWANDYFIKAHPAANEFYFQVGVTASDHGFWGPIEVTHLYTDRTAYKITVDKPGTEPACGTAAAMAASSLVFKTDNPAYSATLLQHAVQLYNFGETYKANYQDSNPDPEQPYISYGGYADELVWGAIWLYLATNDSTYLNKAVQYYPGLGLETNTAYHKYKWTFNWDDSTYACYLMMARLFPSDTQYQADVERYLDWWTIGFNGSQVTYTPGGHARLDQWGSLRYAANTALAAFLYSDWITDAAKKARYKNFAETQINYILGDNPRSSSYICGFGSNPPQHPHHRTAHSSWGRRIENPANHRHILYGALVGSPDTSDGFTDSISDYVSNEVALDYNAALTGCLSKMTSLYGGTPIADSSFPLVDKSYTSKDEYAVFATTYTNSQYSIILSILVENRTAWPARPNDRIKVRYFFTLDAGSISDISVSTSSSLFKLSSPVLWNSSIYYVELDFTGTVIAPGYAWDSGGPLVEFTISSASGTLNSANDWSYQNWDSAYASGSRYYAPNIVMYDGASGHVLNGTEPGGFTQTPSGTPARTRTPTATISATPTASRTAASTLTATPTPTRTGTATRTSTTRTRTPTISVTATRTAAGTPTATSSRTATANITITPTRTSVTATPTATPAGCTCDAGCSTLTVITPNFSKEGIGGYCYEASSLGSYINSWNLTALEVNGVDFTNKYTAAASLPALINGKYYVYYNSTVSYGHFEAMN